ncbi:MAG: DUF4340 domain-containing protein [Candidatus Poribacteria bacterium]|nr:DUF4340 domain-containing protein [Candidatus Poribacteria bacterium]
MDIRKTLTTVGILAGILAVLIGVYVVVTSGGGEKEDDDARPTLGEVYGVASADATRIELDYADPELPDMTLEKEGETWWLTEPVRAVADPAKVEDALRVLNRNIRKRLSGASGANGDDYGFDAPQITMAVTFPSGDKTFLFGNKGVSYALYAKEASDPNALLMEAWVLDEMYRTPAEMRDRTVLRFEPSDARQLVVWGANAAIPVAIKRDGAEGKWRIVTPREAPADQEKVNAVLDALHGLTAVVFLEDNATDPPSDEPTATVITLTMEDGSLRELRISDQPDENGRVVVKVKGSVYAVSPESLAALPSNAGSDIEKWRDLRVADFQRLEARRISVAIDGKLSYTLTRQADRDSALWDITAPIKTSANDTLIAEKLFDLDALTFTEILSDDGAAAAQYGLDAPRLAITIEDGRGAEQTTTIRVGKSVNGGAAVQSTRSPAIGIARADEFDIWRQGMTPFRSTTVLAFDNMDISRIEVKRGKELLAFTRQNVIWRIIVPVVEAADNSIPDGILTAMNGLKVVRFVTPQPTLNKVGLDNPHLEVSLFYRKDMTRKRLLISRPVTSEEVFIYAKFADEPDVFRLSVQTYDAVNVALEDARITPSPSSTPQ